MKNCFKKILFIFYMVSFFSCSKMSFDKARLYQDDKRLLGTQVNVSLIIAGISDAAETIDAVFEEISRIEKLMSPRIENSDVMQINNYAAKQVVQVTAETFKLLQRANFISKNTNGAFDVSYATIGKYWNFKQKPFLLPEKPDINQAVKNTGYQNIVLNEKAGRYQVYFKKSEMRIGLGGIAKGYAIKKAIQVLRKRGIDSGIVEAGGDLQVIGTKFGKKWQAGLIHPRKKELILAVELNNNDCIVTSGDYERYAIVKNVRYNHILDPGTGYPARHFFSVTIVCKDPIDADAYATAFFVMGKEKTQKFLSKNRDIKVILIDLEMNLYVSSELKDRIRIIDKKLKINWF